MSNAIFPTPRSTGTLPGITWNITRAPIFATKIQQAVGGQRIAAAFQPYPIYRWTLEYEFLRAYDSYTEWQTLIGFFNARKGSYDTFLFNDPSDNTVTDQLIGSGTGSLTTFQLLRTLGGFSEPIYNVNSVPVIKLNGVVQVSGYTISSSGLVTFSVAPANGVTVTWTGTYYWRCAFDQDSTEFGMFANNFWQNKKVSFKSTLGA